MCVQLTGELLLCVLVCACSAGAANAGPPAGAVPTFSVTCLPELTQFLLDTAPSAANLEALAAAGGAAAAAASSPDASPSSSSDAMSSIDGLEPGSIALLGWSLRSGSMDSMSGTDSDDDAVLLAGGVGVPLDPSSPGAPAPGLDFFDFLVEQGAVKTATTSFPRMGECLDRSVKTVC